MRVLGISGSLRRDSYNTHLLHAAGELAPEIVELELYDGLGAIPPYDQDIQDEGAPATVQDLRERIAAADVAVVGASTGAYGGVWAQADLRKVLGLIGARVVEGDVAIGHAPERFDADGRLTDPGQRQQLGELLRDLAAQVELRIAA